jgi:NTP pyrophosphatase (non-canonical NTP hydrolase)
VKNDKIFEKFQKECDSQDKMWGIRDQDPLIWMAILTEEIGEVSKEINDSGWDVRGLDFEKYENELIQCGAVITQMIKNIKHYEH